MRCSQCGREFLKESGGESLASISGGIQGDECIESWFFCKECGLYTVEVYWDVFLGDSVCSARGPVTKEEADARIALIRQCDRPWDKKCRCPAHVEYFGGSLD
jgi:hypothetical protein